MRKTVGRLELKKPWWDSSITVLAFVEDVNMWHHTPALGTTGFGIPLSGIAGMGMKTCDLSGNHGGIYVRAFAT